MKNMLFIFLLITALTSCSRSNHSSMDDTIVSMQVIDRNGFTETISNKDRLIPFQSTDFLTPQPYQKVLRVYGRKKDGQSLSKITSYHPNGQIWQYLEVADGRAHGLYREWFSNGELRIETHVVEGLADINNLAQSSWIFDGSSKVWDEQGCLLAEFFYDKGVLDTPAVYYHPNGEIQRVIPYQQGLIHGTELAYDEEGNVLERIESIQGKKHGICTAFWDKDAPLYLEEYQKGLLLSARYYALDHTLVAEIIDGSGKQAQFENGLLYSLTEYQHGVACGKVELFRANGQLESYYTVKDDKKNGEEWEYYPNVTELKPKLCIHWEDDVIQGQVKTWYENGILESQRDVHNNKKQGMSVAWYKNSDLMLIEEYENDLLIKGSYYKKADKQPVSRIEAGNGTATLYTNDGIFLKKITYEKGKPVLHDEPLR